MNLEDETGMVNVIIPVPIWNRYLRAAREASALLIRGKLETNDGAINLVAERMERLPLNLQTMGTDGVFPKMSRDFR